MKHKKLRKCISVAVSLMLVMGICQISAFAAETETSGSGTPEDPKITIIVTEVPSEEGITTTTKTTTTEYSDMDEEGVGTTYQETATETTLTDGEGTVMEQSGSLHGSETTVEERPASTPEVTVPVIEDEQALEDSSATAGAGTAITPNDQGGTTTVIDSGRTAEAEAAEIGITTGSGEGVETQAVLNPIQPNQEEEKNEVHILTLDSANWDARADKPDGYDLYWSGYWMETLVRMRWSVNDGRTWDGTEPVIFAIMDPSAEGDSESPVFHAAYCTDLSTYAQKGWWYKVANLEDAGYYHDEGAENHVRAIVNNGYWGTTEGEGGSLSVMKESLKAAIEADPNALGGLTAADIDLLTDGEALTATQMAIWQYGNRIEEGLLLDGSATLDEGSKARVNAVYNYLKDLSEDSGDTTQIINEEKFIDDMSLTVGEKVADHTSNSDEDDTNDMYHVNLVFSLVVEPNDENDDLIVKVVAADGTVLKAARLAGADSSAQDGLEKITADADGNYTLDGLQLAENENFQFSLKLEGVQYLERGVYIYKSQVENEVDPETGEVVNEETSQTLVGIAEGYRTVDVGMNAALTFNVEEGTITTERTWSDKWSYTNDPEVTPELPWDPDPDPDPEPTPDPQPTPESVPEPEPDPEEIPEVVPPMDTPEEPVPRTGDDMILWMVPATLSGLALVWLVLGSKRKEEN